MKTQKFTMPTALYLWSLDTLAEQGADVLDTIGEAALTDWVIESYPAVRRAALRRS